MRKITINGIDYVSEEGDTKKFLKPEDHISTIFECCICIKLITSKNKFTGIDENSWIFEDTKTGNLISIRCNWKINIFTYTIGQTFPICVEKKIIKATGKEWYYFATMRRIDNE